MESSAGVLTPVGADTTNEPVLLDTPLALEELDVSDALVSLVIAVKDALDEVPPEPEGALLQDTNRQNTKTVEATMTKCFFIGSPLFETQLTLL